MAARNAAAAPVRRQVTGEAGRSEPDAKSERLAARLTPRQKQLLQRAADLTGRSLTDFIVGSALDKAEATIQSYEIIELSERDARLLFDALNNPPKLNEKLAETMRRHRDNVEMR